MNSQVRDGLIGAVAATLTALDKAFLGISDVFSAVTETFQNDKTVLQGLSHFDFDVKWKTRVINIPAAAQEVNDLYHEIKDELVGKFVEAETEVKALIDQLRHGGSLHEPGEPALARAVDVLQDVHSFNLRLAQLIRTVGDIATIIDDIKNRVATLEPLFLPQGKPKSVVDKHYRSRIPQK